MINVMICMEDVGWFKCWLFKCYMEYVKKVGGKILDGEFVGVMDWL